MTFDAAFSAINKMVVVSGPDLGKFQTLLAFADGSLLVVFEFGTRRFPNQNAFFAWLDQAALSQPPTLNTEPTCNPT